MPLFKKNPEKKAKRAAKKAARSTKKKQRKAKRATRKKVRKNTRSTKKAIRKAKKTSKKAARKGTYHKRELKILTWNVFLMMPPAKCPEKKLRAERIAKILKTKSKDFDIVCLQKVFQRARARQLKKDLKSTYPYIYWDNDCKVGFTSGLFVASKVPITLKASLNFKAAKGFEALAPKGAMLFEGQSAGRKFQLLNTHVQGHPSGDDPSEKKIKKYDDTRISQFKELRAFLNKHTKKDVPQIICGDFFCDKGTKQYKKLKELLNVTDGSVQWGNNKEKQFKDTKVITSDTDSRNNFAREFVKKPTVKDFIFSRNLKSKVTIKDRTVYRFKNAWKHKKKIYHYLSYRYALVAKIKL